MGYGICIADCCACHKMFGFNPNKVPSIRIEGVRQPVCEECIRKANVIRKERGDPEIQILPGAYEPCEEHEL